MVSAESDQVSLLECALYRSGTCRIQWTRIPKHLYRYRCFAVRQKKLGGNFCDVSEWVTDSSVLRGDSCSSHCPKPGLSTCFFFAYGSANVCFTILVETPVFRIRIHCIQLLNDADMCRTTTSLCLSSTRWPTASKYSACQAGGGGGLFYIRFASCYVPVSYISSYFGSRLGQTTSTLILYLYNHWVILSPTTEGVEIILRYIFKILL
jgi:hypothetical protein